jgi:hypothetical protein
MCSFVQRDSPAAFDPSHSLSTPFLLLLRGRHRRSKMGRLSNVSCLSGVNDRQVRESLFVKKKAT